MANQPDQDEDDGRVICNMDVEGMRWHDKRVRREAKAARTAAHPDQMTNAETRQFTWSAVLAGLSVVLVFSLVWVLFILFCTQVWLR